MSLMYLSQTSSIVGFLLVILSKFHGVAGQNGEGYHSAVGCFSDSYQNFLELACSGGQTIVVEWVTFGSHRDPACPSDGTLNSTHAYCCVPTCGDCVVSNKKDAQNVFDCDGKQQCSVWTKATYVENCLPIKVTTYMVVLYKCQTAQSVNSSSSTLTTTPSFSGIYCGSNRPTGSSNVSNAHSSTLQPPVTTLAPPLVSGGRRAIVGCYSSFHQQNLNIACQLGEVIAIYGVFFGAKRNGSCPSDGFIREPEQTGCCVPECGDCVMSSASEATYVYTTCSGERECSPWTHRILTDGCGLKEYTSYMVVHYECVIDFSTASNSPETGVTFNNLFACPEPSTSPLPSTALTSPTSTTTPRTTSTKTTIPILPSPKQTPTSIVQSNSSINITPSPSTTSTRPTTVTTHNPNGSLLAVGCYSTILKSDIQINCPLGRRIYIHGVYFGNKRNSACPDNGVVPDGKEFCCEPLCEDCTTNGGNGAVSNIMEQCSMSQNCSVWTQRTYITDCGNKTFTSYMVVHHQCIESNRDISKTMSFEQLYCPPGNQNTLSVAVTGSADPSPPTGRPTTRLPRPNTYYTTRNDVATRSSKRTMAYTFKPSGSSPYVTDRKTAEPPTGSPAKTYPGESTREEEANERNTIGAVIGGIAGVLIIGALFVLFLNCRRKLFKKKANVTRGHSLDRKGKRSRKPSKNHSHSTNSTHLNSVVVHNNLTVVNVTSSGRLPGKGDYNHLERWLGDLATNDIFDLPRISEGEMSESDTDADIDKRVRGLPESET